MRTQNDYARRWGLSEFEHIEKQVYFCVSQQHGPCVFKLNDNPYEAQALREYSNTRFCKLYEADEVGGAMLLERIIPGTSLRDIPNLDRRLSIFCDVWQGLHIPPADKSNYLTYMDWVSRITEYMRGRGDYKALYEKMAKAERICRELCKKYTGAMLLHGDLHQWNILTGEQGRWRVIDPKGVVGDPVFDIPRFILNEFAFEQFSEKLLYITGVLSDRLGIDERDLRRLTYVETCMCHCWFLEDGEEPNLNSVLTCEALME